LNISPLDIKKKQFKLKFRGFDITEVDAFLEEVTAEFETLARENEALKEERTALAAQVAECRENEKSLRDTLIAAQKMADEMRAAAEREVELKIKEAELEAEKILADADRRLAKTDEEIAELGRIRERFTLKIKGVIEDHLKMLSYEEQQEGRE
jgi:cell division initiation protein